MLILRLKPAGKKKQIIYHIVVTEHTSPIKGKFVEQLGTYNPRTEQKLFNLNQERIKYWISKGVKFSNTVNNLFCDAKILPDKNRIKKTVVKKQKKTEEEKSEKTIDKQDQKNLSEQKNIEQQNITDASEKEQKIEEKTTTEKDKENSEKTA